MDLAESLIASSPERALQLLNPILEPLDERVAWLQAQSLASLKKSKDAIEFLRASFEKNPGWPMAPFWLGRLYSLESDGAWNARKYLMTFLKRSEKAADLEAPEAATPEIRKLRAARAEAEAILTRVNRSLE
jgi:tetratricopeptide (TPR) repeat protein